MNAARLVETDAYDRDACARALLRTPEARGLVERGSRVLPHFDALVEDLFAIAFKLVVRLREGPPSTALNRRLLGAVIRSPGLSALHETCSLDEARSASVALALARVALAEVKKGELFTEEELLDQADLTEQESRVAALETTRRALVARGGPAAARLLPRIERELARAAASRDELAGRVARTLASLPPGLEARLERVAGTIAETLEDEEELSRTFTEAIGARGPVSAADRVALADRLRGSEKLKKLASLAGAFRREALATRKRRIRRTPHELHRIGRGAELARLLPAELAGFTRGARRLDFLRRLVERELAQYDLVGADRGGRGPLVVCVDGSGSMAGPRELWAKAVTLALLEIARRQNRRAEAILFSGRETPLARFSLLTRNHHGAGGRRLVDLPEVLDFAAAFPGGGTDFEKPLGAALDLLETIDLKGGDVVFVTDGEATVTDEFAVDLARLKEKLDFAVYAVLVDDAQPAAATRSGRSEIDRARRELGKVADRITTVTRLTSGAVQDLFERV
jgi:uncharacterized protein with von Willebrand factor type A (vWA) domain